MTNGDGCRVSPFANRTRRQSRRPRRRAATLVRKARTERARAQSRRGKTSLSQKATARPPAHSPAFAAVPAAAAGTFTLSSLGQQLREVLPPRRLHSVSLCDREANVLWLSEGALGNDEESVNVVDLDDLVAVTY